MRRHALEVIALLVVAAAALSGCLYDLECTDIAKVGVSLRIVELGGAREEPIVVRYRVDGGEWRDDAECTADRQSCGLGVELAGSYEIEVTRGAVTVRVETEVHEDRCHVITEELTIELPDV